MQSKEGRRDWEGVRRGEEGTKRWRNKSWQNWPNNPSLSTNTLCYFHGKATAETFSQSVVGLESAALCSPVHTQPILMVDSSLKSNQRIIIAKTRKASPTIPKTSYLLSAWQFLSSKHFWLKIRFDSTHHRLDRRWHRGRTSLRSFLLSIGLKTYATS